jgi:hypothetical protein
MLDPKALAALRTKDTLTMFATARDWLDGIKISAWSAGCA